MRNRAFIPVPVLMALLGLVAIIAAAAVWGHQMLERTGFDLRFSGALGIGWGLLLGIVLGALAWWLYRREPAGRGARALLPLIRAVVLIMLILMLTGPSIERRTEVGEKGRALIYVDATESMDVKDEQMEIGRKVLIAHALGWLGSDTVDTTLAEAAEVLTRAIEAGDELAAGANDPARAEAAAERLIELAGDAIARIEAYDHPIHPPPDRAEGPTGEVTLETWRRPEVTGAAELEPEAIGRPARSQRHRGASADIRAGQGMRMRGHLHPPRSGDYELVVEAPGAAELLLSPGPERHAARPLPQGQRLIRLDAGRAHYFELRVIAEQDGRFSLGWQGPEGGQAEHPIPEDYLSPFNGSGRSGDMKQRLLHALGTDIIEAVQPWAAQPPAASAEALRRLDAIRDSAVEVRNALDGAFEQKVEQMLAGEQAPALAEALERFEQRNRWQRAERMLLMDDGVISRLLEDFEVELRPFGIDDKALLWGSRGQDRPLVPEGLDAEPVGPRTDLAAPLRHAGRGRDVRPGQAIGQQAEDGAAAADADENTVAIMLTDGQHNHDEPGARSPEQVARDLARRGVRLFTLGHGAARPPRDMALLGFRDVPEQVFREGQVTGKLRIYEAMPEGQSYTVTIAHEGHTLWHEQMTTRGIGAEAAPEAMVRELEFEFSAEEAARAAGMLDGEQLRESSMPLTLDVRISELPGETDLENNHGVLMTRVVDHQRRVLLVDGRPRWAYRFLRNMFRRDDKWQLNAVLPDFSEGAEGVLPRGGEPGTFPADRDELFTYDLVIFGELPAHMLREEELQWLSQFVVFRGGGVIFIDGPRQHLREYRDSPIESLLPVEWGDGPLQNAALTFRVTDLGEDFPALALDGDPDRKAETWRHLPTPHFLPQTEPREGAEVLIEADERGRRVPVMVARATGAGRVFYSATDETFRWRDRVADRYEAAFWPSVATWVMETPFHVRDDHVALGLDRISYEPGRPVAIRARLYDGAGRPVTRGRVEAHVMRGDELMRKVEMEGQDHEGGLFQGQTATGEGEAFEPGSYSVHIETPDHPDIPASMSTVFQVLPEAPAQGERALVFLNEPRLRRLAREGGGGYYREEQGRAVVERLSGTVERRTILEEIALWRHFGWFAAIIGLLTVEWIVRKRAGML